jgi:hypothetical protein
MSRIVAEPLVYRQAGQLQDRARASGQGRQRRQLAPWVRNFIRRPALGSGHRLAIIHARNALRGIVLPARAQPIIPASVAPGSATRQHLLPYLDFD